MCLLNQRVATQRRSLVDKLSQGSQLRGNWDECSKVMDWPTTDKQTHTDQKPHPGSRALGKKTCVWHTFERDFNSQDHMHFNCIVQKNKNKGKKTQPLVTDIQTSNNQRGIFSLLVIILETNNWDPAMHCSSRLFCRIVYWVLRKILWKMQENWCLESLSNLPSDLKDQERPKFKFN